MLLDQDMLKQVLSLRNAVEVSKETEWQNTVWVSPVLILRALGNSYSQLEARISADTSSAVSGTTVASGSYSSGDFTAVVVCVSRTSHIW